MFFILNKLYILSILSVNRHVQFGATKPTTPIGVFTQLQNHTYMKMSDFTKVFITGVQRSGTTLLATLLTNHPKIYVAPKVKSYRWLANFNSYERLLLRHPNVDKQTVFRHFFKKDTELFSYQLENQPTPSAINLLNGTIDTFLKEKNKRIWLEKAPHMEFYSRDLFYYYPNAKIIHLIRDGRAVAASRYHRKSNNIRAAAQEWMQSCSIAMAHQQLIFYMKICCGSRSKQ